MHLLPVSGRQWAGLLLLLLYLQRQPVKPQELPKQVVPPWLRQVLVASHALQQLCRPSMVAAHPTPLVTAGAESSSSYQTASPQSAALLQLLQQQQH